jgi:hypothetical protein
MRIASPEDVGETWQRASDVAQQTLDDLANRAKDKADEALDAKRIHCGMTLDEFLHSPDAYAKR